ncbi:MAG: UDP-2,3-diacylglucosamine diphosphatase [Bacteroidales bacterium]|nr:UDP-2,3-diacylglucosamine diphosphatase [Bacteroidales bacterium]
MKERNKVYFASDFHLGSPSHKNVLDVERKLVRWLNSIADEAKAIYLLGDIFDFWYELRMAVPKGFTRVLGKLAELNDQGVEIHLFVGNHDVWMFDYLPKEIGAVIHTGSLLTRIEGKTFFLAHGDGLGERSFGFRFIRWVFHNKFCQRLYSSIHPRWSFALAQYLSRKSRENGEKREADYKGEQGEELISFAKKHLAENPEIDFFVFGHRHILLDMMLSHNSRLFILGDWIRYFSYLEFDGTNVSLEQFEMES